MNDRERRNLQDFEFLSSGNEGPPPPDPAPVDVNRRLAFLEWSETDAANVRALSDAFGKSLDSFVEQFYAHLFRFPETSKFLQDAERVAKLKEKQKDHFIQLLEGRWDEATVELRHRVGQTHAEVGLEPYLFLGAYQQYVRHCFQQLAMELGPSAKTASQQAMSLVKAIFMDVGLTLDAYFHQSTVKLHNVLQMYWRANIELRRFAQLTSHDLKTPLATVANLCDETLDEFGEQIPAEARALIESARQSAFKMSGLINELLESTLAPQSTESHDQVSTREIIIDAVDRVRPMLRQKQIELMLPEMLPEVWGNRVRLREAFYNLLSNAAKFIDKRPGRIEVEVEPLAEACVLKIRDNGPGIPEPELERVFIPFRRLPAHRDQPGTGLGLYFAKSMIEEQGGRIWAESKLGEGTVFFVQLPRGPAAASSHANRKSDN